MKIEFSESALKDFQYFKKNNSTEYFKIKKLLNDIIETPFSGLGKPEKLKENLAGYYSRRITKEHRLVYHVSKTSIIIASCRYHYSK